MLKNGHPEIIPFPHKNVHEAIQRGDVVGLLGCIQVHILQILANTPLIYDVQKNISDHIVALLRDNAKEINPEQESSMRELLQTVYRGMRHANTRRDSIARSVEKGLPLLEKIMTGKHIPSSILLSHTPPASTEIVGEASITPSPVPNESEGMIEPEKKVETLKKSKYSSDTPPKVPERFQVDWDAKKWKAFSLFYGYSAKTGTFDGKTHTRAQIAEILGVTIMDVAVYFTTTHQHIASWVPKVKKAKKQSETIKKTPRVVKEKPVKEKKPSSPKPAKIQKKALKIVQKTPIKTTPINGNEEDEEDEDATDEETKTEIEEDEEKKNNSGKGKILIDLGDGKGTLMRHNLNHTLLTPEEEKELGTTIQNEIARCNQIQLNQDLLDNILHLFDFTPPKNSKNIPIKKIKRRIEILPADGVLTGDILTSVRTIASLFLAGNKQQKEISDSILSEINSKMTEIGQAAIDKLVKHNRRLVMSIALRHVNRGVDIDDLFQEGCIGLYKAAGRFDPITFDNKFGTHATWWIKQSITRAVSNQSRTIRVPVHLQAKYSVLQRVIHLISSNIGHQPTNEEISDEVGIPVAKIIELKQAMHTISSLDAPLNGDSDSATVGDLTADTRTPGSDQGAILSDDHETLTSFLETLIEKERDILHRRFGMNGYNIQTLEEVGRHYGVTRERIRQIEAKALRKMNKKMGHRNPFQEDNGGESPLRKATIDMLLEEMKKAKLTSEEKNLLIAWGGLGQKAESLSSIADHMKIPLSRVMIIKIDALKKVPLFVRQALELRGYKNNQ